MISLYEHRCGPERMSARLKSDEVRKANGKAFVRQLRRPSLPQSFAREDMAGHNVQAVWYDQGILGSHAPTAANQS